MKLKLKDVFIDENESIYPVKRKLDSKIGGGGKGLLLLRIDIGVKQLSPYHWFLDDEKKLPLDLAIHSEKGIINYIKFFFIKDKISNEKPIEIDSISHELDGVPIFDISIYNDRLYQVFEKGEVLSSYIDNNLYLLIKGMNIETSVKIDSKTSFLFDKENFFGGLVIKSLMEAEIDELKIANLL